jgi:GDP-4-dehydro-6-deoxy-D-mannose reductase
MNQTILVTGANGFVGHHVVRELHNNGYTVISTGKEASEELAPLVEKHYSVDLTDATSVDTIDFSNVDGIIHLAGLAAVGPSFDNPMLYISANMGMEVNLYEAARKQNASPRFVVVSSGSLYDAKVTMPITELSPIKPSSPYAVSKIGQEQLVAYYGNRGFESVVARPFNHIGPGQNTGFILPDLAKQIIEAKKNGAKTIKVGTLTTERDYTDVRDIARAYRLLFEKGKAGETYNICSGKSISGQTILDTLLAVTEAEITAETDPTLVRPVDTSLIYGDSSKLSKDTGWTPEISFEKTVADTIADWRSRVLG